ncbi:GlmU family protein [Saprospiraceae bacterium]|nr:GlmU family protein [Saprospiraceae bacterium]
MKNVILFDDESRDNLLPLVYTKPVSELRCGILTIREKWEIYLNSSASFITQEYLMEKYPINVSDDNWIINGSLLPNPGIVKLINSLETNEAILSEGELLAARLDFAQFQLLNNDKPIEEISGIELKKDEGYSKIKNLSDIFSKNGEEISMDFELLTKHRKSQDISKTNTILGDHPIFVEEGAKVECSILNATDGPIYIGIDAEIMEGSLVRGPFAMNAHSVLKMGAKVYGSTTLGPFCKVGGEVNNVVFTGYSSKGHDGFLGNSVIGEWCNFGADSNNSNLKNNYADVKLWNYKEGSFAQTDLQFCGLIMGDHSKCGINSMFNTGTVIGVNCNLFGTGFPRNFVPSFSWGGAQGYKTYAFDKAIETAQKVMSRRNIELTELDVNIMQSVFNLSGEYRNWEKN